MKYRRIIAGLLIAGTLTAMFGFIGGADDPIGKIAAQLDKWLQRNPQEKVYLHLDKPYYAIGDNIWFKAYITVNGRHELSGLSGVLNVELINDRDSVKQSVKLPVFNGLAWGDFTLADSLAEGNYHIRAYTNWMRNAGEDYFFNKAIAVVNAISNNVFTKTAYSYTTRNGQQTVNGIINYTNLDGVPYTGKAVSYEVQLNNKTIEKGKGVTDEKGNLPVTFTSASQSFSSGRIVTGIKLGDKKTATKVVDIRAISQKVDVRFFPEGGSLINGNLAKIAFKAVGADGLGTDIRGIVADEQNHQAATFSSSHLGMGVFEMVPEPGKSYHANITYADGSAGTVALPQASSTGYALQIDNSDVAVIKVRIVPGSTNPSAEISLIGQSGGVICYAAKNKSAANGFYAVVPKSKFPSGIAQFTLFSSTGEPLNERLVFIDNADQLKLDVTSDKEVYASRQKVRIDLTANNKRDKPVIGSFSVAVTDETKVPVNEDEENSIMANLLLTSDIRGYIEKPNYYFNHNTEKTRSDLDALMLTQGYHRFEWKQVMNETYPAIVFQPERSLEIRGHLKTTGGKPVANGKVTLFTTAGGAFVLDTVSDANGSFAFRNLIFRDSIRFVVQARTSKNRKNVEIELDNIAPQVVSTNKNAPDMQVNISSNLSPFMQNSRQFYNDQLKYGLINHAIILKEVVIKEKKAPLTNSSNLNGAGNADQILQANQISTLACPRIADCLQGRLFGVTFRNGVPYLNRSFNTPMEIVIDGAYGDADFLNDLNANDIESIEVLKSIAYTSIYGGRGGGGVLVVTTKRGQSDYGFQRYAPGIITYVPKGYYKAKEFYSPQYDDPKINKQIPDLRSTIYWKPDIITRKDGKATIAYFNADTRGTYRVVIEGIDDEGNLGRQVYRYKVE